jgi:hypothetical protein
VQTSTSDLRPKGTSKLAAHPARLNTEAYLTISY